MSNPWDVIIVGARCAGCTLATVLARKGVRTLLLEASPRGTDMPMSTHYLHAPAMEVLDRLGIGARVRAVTPPTRVGRVAMDDATFLAPLDPARPGYCVRRATLDPWLQETAEASGAELRDRSRVVELSHDGGRVSGVVVETPTGRRTERARLVVGADGMHSTVAKLSGAEEYLSETTTRGGYWMYFPAPSSWDLPWDLSFEYEGTGLRYVFRTDGDLLLALGVTPVAEAASWGKEWRRKLREMLAGAETTRSLTRGKEPVGKGMGFISLRYFYRRAAGPGYALIGDAGHFKDFVTGHGMTDAFLDAERLADAVLDGRELALERFWRERDVVTLPLHFDALRRGRADYNTPFMRWIFACLAARPDLHPRLAATNDRMLSPYDLVPTGAMLRWMGSALVRGRLDVLAGFLRVGQAIAGEQREIQARKKLLSDVEGRLARH